MRSIALFVLSIFAFASIAPAQAASTLPTATPAQSSLSMNCPAPATGSQVWRCTGNAATCTGTSNNWTQIGTIATATGSYVDTTGLIGTAYTYAGVCTEGTTVAAPSNFYVGTPASPLVAGTLSGATS